MRQFLPDEAATVRFGTSLATTLEPGDVVLLNGDLGTGKTVIARAIIRALTTTPTCEVPSPSFALVQPYNAAKALILHADLYRLGNPQDVEELGLLDNAEAIVLVEWPDRSPEIIQAATLTLTLTIPADGKGRLVTTFRR